MTSDRKKPGVAFWATVVVVAVLMGYPLSFGPACWIRRQLPMNSRIRSALYEPYRPLTYIEKRSETFLHAMLWYRRLFSPPDE